MASSKLWMLEFSAFLEQQQDPDTVGPGPCLAALSPWSSPTFSSSCSTCFWLPSPILPRSAMGLNLGSSFLCSLSFP